MLLAALTTVPLQISPRAVAPTMDAASAANAGRPLIPPPLWSPTILSPLRLSPTLPPSYASYGNRRDRGDRDASKVRRHLCRKNKVASRGSFDPRYLLVDSTSQLRPRTEPFFGQMKFSITTFSENQSVRCNRMPTYSTRGEWLYPEFMAAY
jgi:hypothetical protein